MVPSSIKGGNWSQNGSWLQALPPTPLSYSTSSPVLLVTGAGSEPVSLQVWLAHRHLLHLILVPNLESHLYLKHDSLGEGVQL